GEFTVTFTLTGFKTVRREGIQVNAGATVNLSVDLAVGAVEETITVSGETPLVDVQNATRHEVITKEVFDALPTGKTTMGVAVLIAGMRMNSPLGASAPPRDVGGNQGDFALSVTMPGNRISDARPAIEGMYYNNLLGTGGGSNMTWSPNSAMIEQVTVDVTGNIEALTAAPLVHTILRDGGNQIRGDLYGTFTNGSLAADNLTPELNARGVTTLPDNLIVDTAATIGGPIKRDKLWVVGAIKYNLTESALTGGFF